MSKLSFARGLELGTLQDAQASTSNSNSSRIAVAQFNGNKPLPSQVFASVAQRFLPEELHEAAQERFSTASQKKILTQVERSAKLDALIQSLDEKAAKSTGNQKQANITSQVRRMLLKSRSEGDKKLRPEDRFFLEVVVITEAGDDNVSCMAESMASSMYRFFSRVATVGRVASSCSARVPSAAGREQPAVEFLVKRKAENDDATRYWRLPNTMPLHECEGRGFLEQFEQIVIRRFSPEHFDSDTISGATTSILDMTKDLDVSALEEKVASGTPQDGEGSCSDGKEMSTQDNFRPAGDISDIERNRFSRIERAVNGLEAKGCTSKRNSSTSEKVRQILIKSRAKGDRRWPDNDRYYLHVVRIDDFDNQMDDSNTVPAVASFYQFYSINSEKAADVIASVCKDDNISGVSSELLAAMRGKVESMDSAAPAVSYYRISDGMTLNDADSKGFLKQFSQVIVRRFKDGTPATERMAK